MCGVVGQGQQEVFFVCKCFRYVKTCFPLFLHWTSGNSACENIPLSEFWEIMLILRFGNGQLQRFLWVSLILSALIGS